MSYRLNKTDGTLLVELVDGKVDSSTTNLTFIGKNYQGFGEFLNENFIKLLETFSSSTPPNKPIKGQLWYDSASGRLKVYDGVTFRSTDSTIYEATQPQDLIEGDIWINGSKDQLYFWNGTETVLVGPAYDKTQGLSSNVVETIRDTTGQNKIVVKFYIGGSLIGIYAKEAFTPYPAITGFDTLKVGFNINSAFSNFTWLGTANSAKQIIDEIGNVFDQNSFLSSTGDDTTQGRIHIQNDNGLLVGNDSDHTIKIQGTTTTFQNNLTNSDLQILLRDGGGTFEAMYFDTSTKTVGLFNPTPNALVTPPGKDSGNLIRQGLVIGTEVDPHNLVVTGDMRINGDLVVGTVVNEEVKVLRVADTQIQLAISEDSSLLDSTSEFLDDAGITIENAGGSIKWTYELANDSWSSTQDINLRESTGEYQIETVKVLDRTSLGSTVVNSSLQTVGTLQSLQVDDIQIDGNEISSTTGSGIDIDIIGALSFTNNVNGTRIGGVKTPTSARDVIVNPLLTESDDLDVATKEYVDKELNGFTRSISFDVTGLSNPDPLGTSAGPTDDIIIMLNEVLPIKEGSPLVQVIPNGTKCRVFASAITATTDPIDVNSQVTKSFTAVDSAGVQNVNVIGDFSIADPTANVGFTVTRYHYEFIVQSELWVYVSGSATVSAV